MSASFGNYLVGMLDFVVGMACLMLTLMLVAPVVLAVPGIVLMFIGGGIVEGITIQEFRDDMKRKKSSGNYQ